MKNDAFYIIFSLAFLGVFYLFFFNFIFTDVTRLRSEKSHSIENQQVNNLFLVVIDSLRYDTIHGAKNKDKFKKLNSILHQDKSICLETKLQTPSVTAGRVKSIASGTTPLFSDTLFDVKPTPDMESNILYELKSRNWKIRFVGDAVWPKLYPGIFNESVSFNPLNFNDYTPSNYQVASNIGKIKLYNKNEKNMMIMHFLGAHHYGKKARKENFSLIDDAISNLYEEVKKLPNSMLIITGDHGLTDLDNRPGSSEGKFSTLTLFLSEKLQKTEGLCREPLITSYQQDLSTTIALLTGISIPKASLGLPNYELFMNLYRNNTTLMKTLLLKTIDHFEDLLEWKFSQGQTASDMYFTKDFDSPWLTSLVKDLKDCHGTDKKCIGEQESNLIKIFDLLKSLQSKLVNHVNIPQDKILLSLCIVIMMIIILIIWSQYLKYLYDSVKVDVSPVFKDQWSPVGTFRYLLVAFFVLILFHSLSLNGSSFVEEEHQIWYYFSPTILVLSTFPIIFWHQHHSAPGKMLFTDLLPVVLLVIIDRFLGNFHPNGDRWRHVGDLASYFESNEGIISQKTVQYLSFILFTIIRFLSLKNYQIRPKMRIPGPVGIEFNAQSNWILSWILHWSPLLTGLGVFYAKVNMLDSEGYPKTILEQAYYGRIALFVLLLDLFFGIYHNAVIVIKKRLTIEEQVDKHKSITLFMTGQAPGLISQTIFLLMFSLSSPVVGLLWAMVLIKDFLLNEYCTVLIIRLPLTDNEVLKMILFMIYWTQAWVTFFQQGNSNKLATVNFSVGLFGQTTYNSVIASILVAVYTFNGFFYWITTFFFKILPLITRKRFQASNTGLQKSFTLGTIILPVGMFSLTCLILRHHQLTWSVFTPKLVYMGLYVTFILPFYALNVFIFNT